MKIKMLLYIFLVMFLSLGIFTTLYLNTSPQIGGKKKEHSSANFKNGKFQNLTTTNLSSKNTSLPKAMYKFFFDKDTNAYPKKTIHTLTIDKELLENLSDDDVSVTWLGHSTALIKSENLTIITDPILNPKKIPPLNLGPKPFPYSTTYQVKNLPKLDIVLISHDHYDHLDLDTIQEIAKNKNVKFFVPLGVSSHLELWGVEKKNIYELDWYDEKEYSEDLTLTFAPARHFSGRGLFNGKTTLWGSWIISLENKKIYFGGDSGYSTEFKKIGKEYGPFDLAMLDCGQYNEAWQDVHMLPEEVVQASLDLKAKSTLPIHWGKYILSIHAWYEPIERVSVAAKKKSVNLKTPQIGKTFLLDKDVPNKLWWK